MQKYYDKENNRLVFEGEAADERFWDKEWNRENFKKTVENNGKRDRFISKITKKFLKSGKTVKILEGGCGMGHFVYSLALNGYDAYGIDFAAQTIKNIKDNFPELKVSCCDVRKINFPDNYFDGYWSLGVIEHFFSGYDQISDEMRRVVKNGGYLFITFPYLSRLRKLKNKLKFYQLFNHDKFREDKFYQFALDLNQVIKHFQGKGFSLVYKKSLDAAKGIEEEIIFLNFFWKKVYGSPSIIFKTLRFFINKFFSPLCGHIVLLVFRKK